MKRVKLPREELGIDLKPQIPDPRIISVEEIPIPRTPEQIKAREERKKMILERRARSVNEKPTYHHTLQMINVELIQDNYSAWNHFDLPDQVEQYDLMRSIESVGLLNPIYVTIDRTGVISVIIGRVRTIAYCNLFEQTGLEKYHYIPAYVIPFDEIDELQIRNMMIESNICFRKISKFNMIRALIENYEIMRMTKEFRNEKNVGMEIAKMFHISEATTFNFLKIRDLCEKGLAFLYDEKISLQAATYLTKVPKNTQEKILDTYGIEGVKAIHRLKLLTHKYDITMEDLEKLMKKAEDIDPTMTTVSVSVCNALIDPFMKHMLKFKGQEAKIEALRGTGSFSKVFKTKFNKLHMQYYLEKGRIDETTLNKLQARNMKKMAEAE